MNCLGFPNTEATHLPTRVEVTDAEPTRVSVVPVTLDHAPSEPYSPVREPACLSG